MIDYVCDVDGNGNGLDDDDDDDEQKKKEEACFLRFHGSSTEPWSPSARFLVMDLLETAARLLLLLLVLLLCLLLFGPRIQAVLPRERWIE